MASNTWQVTVQFPSARIEGSISLEIKRNVLPVEKCS